MREGHDTDQVCVCVKYHCPVPNELHLHHILPLADGGTKTPQNEVYLCPTTHLANVHELYAAMKKYKGNVPWDIRKNFSPYARNLAEEGYRRYLIFIKTTKY